MSVWGRAFRALKQDAVLVLCTVEVFSLSPKMSTPNAASVRGQVPARTHAGPCAHAHAPRTEQAHLGLLSHRWRAPDHSSLTSA